MLTIYEQEIHTQYASPKLYWIVLGSFYFCLYNPHLSRIETLLAISIFLHFFFCFLKRLSIGWSFGWDPSNCPLLYVPVPLPFPPLAFPLLPPCRNPTLGLSVRMQLTLPKVGKWSSPGLSKIQSSIARAKSPCI